jgi:peptide deformylase
LYYIASATESHCSVKVDIVSELQNIFLVSAKIWLIMAIRRILDYTEEPLHKSAEKVVEFGKETKTIVSDLIDTLYSSTGVGLAAPQIGINKQIFIYDAKRKFDEKIYNYKVLINPKITILGNEKRQSKEGCKSTPDLFVNLRRYSKIVVEGFDENGNIVKFDSKGIEAQVIQHEVDHLDGKLIFEHEFINEKDKNLYNDYVSDTKNILDSLKFANEIKDGQILKTLSNNNTIHLFKDGDQIQMYFSDKGKFSGIMSRIDVKHPLRLIGIYTQAMMLSLVFSDIPEKVYLIGFGGGRIPMILHHYFHKTVIESTEIDSEVVDLSKKYFGIYLDERMIVENTDGRSYLQNQNSDKKYDIIIVDTFSGSGVHPFPFSTIEFYDLCKKHLSENGVVTTNLVETDPLFQQKVKTFIESFKYVYEFLYEGTHVYFGSESVNIKIEDFIKKAKRIDKFYNFRFPLDWLAKKVNIVKKSDSTSNGNVNEELLSDKSNPSEKINIFSGVSRNDLCPCGSGKKYKRCHLLKIIDIV